MITHRRKFTTKIILYRISEFLVSILPLESIQTHSPGLYTTYTERTPKFSATSDAHSRHAMTV